MIFNLWDVITNAGTGNYMLKCRDIFKQMKHVRNIPDSENNLFFSKFQPEALIAMKEFLDERTSLG